MKGFWTWVVWHPYSNFYCFESLVSETKQKVKKIQKIKKNLTTMCLELIFWKNCYQKTFKSAILIRLRQYVFDRHALFKEIHVRCNQAPFANKSIYMYVCTYLFAINKKNHYNTFQWNTIIKKTKFCYTYKISRSRMGSQIGVNLIKIS